MAAPLCCLSIVFPRRTLDLQLGSLEERDRFVDCLHALRDRLKARARQSQSPPLSSRLHPPISLLSSPSASASASASASISADDRDRASLASPLPSKQHDVDVDVDIHIHDQQPAPHQQGSQVQEQEQRGEQDRQPEQERDAQVEREEAAGEKLTVGDAIPPVTIKSCDNDNQAAYPEASSLVIHPVSSSSEAHETDAETKEAAEQEQETKMQEKEQVNEQDEKDEKDEKAILESHHALHLDTSSAAYEEDIKQRDHDGEGEENEEGEDEDEDQPIWPRPVLLSPVKESGSLRALKELRERKKLPLSPTSELNDRSSLSLIDSLSSPVRPLTLAPSSASDDLLEDLPVDDVVAEQDILSPPNEAIPLSLPLDDANSTSSTLSLDDAVPVSLPLDDDIPSSSLPLHDTVSSSLSLDTDIPSSAPLHDSSVASSSSYDSVLASSSAVEPVEVSDQVAGEVADEVADEAVEDSMFDLNPSAPADEELQRAVAYIRQIEARHRLLQQQLDQLRHSSS